MKPSRLALTTTGSVLSAVLSSLPLSCCAFPTTFSLLAVGGLASATALMPYRPYLIVLTFLFLRAGFFFAYWPQSEHRRPSITCAPVNSGRFSGQACGQSHWRQLVSSPFRTFFPIFDVT